MKETSYEKSLFNIKHQYLYKTHAFTFDLRQFLGFLSNIKLNDLF